MCKHYGRCPVATDGCLDCVAKKSCIEKVIIEYNDLRDKNRKLKAQNERMFEQILGLEDKLANIFPWHQTI